jgi:hypothetical protein
LRIAQSSARQYIVSTGLVGSVVVGKSQIVEGDFCRRIIYRLVNARGACDREVFATKHNQALRMKARLLTFGFSLLL